MFALLLIYSRHTVAVNIPAVLIATVLTCVHTLSIAAAIVVAIVVPMVGFRLVAGSGRVTVPVLIASVRRRRLGTPGRQRSRRRRRRTVIRMVAVRIVLLLLLRRMALLLRHHARPALEATVEWFVIGGACSHDASVPRRNTAAIAVVMVAVAVTVVAAVRPGVVMAGSILLPVGPRRRHRWMRVVVAAVMMVIVTVMHIVVMMVMVLVVLRV